MIVNDLQRLRWQILDECLRDTETEYFMGGAKREKETEKIKCLLAQVNRRLRSIKREYKCSKRQLQLDVELFEKKGGRLEPRFRRGHKRILRYINLQWKNPLLRGAAEMAGSPLSLSALSKNDGQDTLALRLNGVALEEMGCAEVIIKTDITEDTVRCILGYGASIEVVEPCGLREQILGIIRKQLDVYSREPLPIVAPESGAIPSCVEEETPLEEENPFMSSELEPIDEQAIAREVPVVEPAPESPIAIDVEQVAVEAKETKQLEEAPTFNFDELQTVEAIEQPVAIEQPKAEPEKKEEPKHQAGEQLSMFDDLFG